MSTRRGRGRSRLPVRPAVRPAVKKQNVPPADDMDSPNLSSIDNFSFLEGIRGLNGNPPLHSTAIEEDLNAAEKEQATEGRAGKKEIPKKTTNKQRGAAAKRKETGGAKREKEPNIKRQKRTGGGVQTSPDRVTAGEKTPGKKSAVPKRSSQPATAAAAEKRLVGKKLAKRKGSAQTSPPRSLKSASENSQKDPSQEQRDLNESSARKRTPLSSDEENMDTSWEPSPKKTTLRLNRKSSTESSSSEERPADTPRRKRKRPPARQQTEFDVVLDAFLEFCDKYRESAAPPQVQQSISTFSKNVEAQLLEKISSLKEFKGLKRENTKMCSLIRTKTRRLLDRKQEMLGTEKEICQLETEKAQLQHRLTLLRRGQSFLQDIRELNRRYLDHRRRHPHQKETYGASSLPALLLETRHMKAALPQRKGDNAPAKKKTRAKK